MILNGRNDAGDVIGCRKREGDVPHDARGWPFRMISTRARGVLTAIIQRRTLADFPVLLCRSVMHCVRLPRFAREATLTGFEPVLPP
jgi:hypothetical protein